jgi:hypothetical protein
VPFNYLSLVWAMILAFAVWGDVPTPALLVGSAIVVASGLLHPVARDLTSPTPGGPSAAARVVPPSGLRRVLRKEANRQLSADNGPSRRVRVSCGTPQSPISQQPCPDQLADARRRRARQPVGRGKGQEGNPFNPIGMPRGRR